MDAGRESGRDQRFRQEIAVVNGQADGIAAAGVEIGMRHEKCAGFTERRAVESIDIVMAVAFGMGDADERSERSVTQG